MPIPEKLAVTDVFLLSQHPVKYNRLSNIYHGQYKNANGEQVEIALKVLGIFAERSEEQQELWHHRFMQEALVWHDLKHRNIEPFFGVDSTMFPHPARAMVSRWMAQGSVLEYIAKNSPVAQYAVELLHDVIQGLSFLHSANIVHGDLCGRTILIDANGRVCLSDFGLASLVESGPVLISSARWNAPELSIPGPSLKPTHLSDVWAFGCVCGEIWTEGIAPFSHFPDERDIPILAFADPNNNSTVKQPYQTRPSDKQGTLMPDRLWELTQQC
ncbi:kinase-like domain-containing protein [Mycena olivaceomarginata]|nr:kinase-like domain-containing protein [Mycena olivaceomarginata]